MKKKEEKNSKERKFTYVASCKNRLIGWWKHKKGGSSGRSDKYGKWTRLSRHDIKKSRKAYKNLLRESPNIGYHKYLIRQIL